jgi:GNAT superfamily N-acetyltransferase
MIIRPYKQTDLNSFFGLVSTMRTERYVYNSVSYELIDPYYYEDYILGNSNYITLVAVDKSGVIGFIVGSIYVDTIDIKILFTDRELRRQGIGRKLKRRLAKIAEELGKRSITAYNAYSNSASYALNIQEGWEITQGENEDEYKAELVFHKQNGEEK